jgi:hypothetical protein
VEPDKARRFVESLAEVSQPPFQVVEAVVGHRWSFAMRHSPSERASDEEPPVRLDEHADIIPIDGLLGLYAPERQEITIFNQGIVRVAQRLSLSVPDTTFAVRLHEWAHALLHVGLAEEARRRVTQDDSAWPAALAAATAQFLSFESGLHERLAQLLVHHGLQTMRAGAKVPEAQAALDRRAAAFERLTQHAPADYHIHRYLQASSDRIVTSIGLLKSRGIVGLTAWDTVVTW